MVKRSRKKKGRNILLISLFVTIILLVIYVYNYNKYNYELKINDINKHYNKYVIVNNDSKIYKYINNEYQEYGTIYKNQELIIKDKNFDYFKIDGFDGEYYIYYSDVSPTYKMSLDSDRYKKYIVFNKNIITNDITNFYDDDKLVYTINNSFNLPIIIMDNDRYGVEVNNKLLYVNKSDVLEVVYNSNTDLVNTKSIGALNYHFFWDDSTESPSACSQIICHSKSNFQKQLDYIRDNNILTLKMNEVEMYIDGKIQLPNSVIITIDDGWRMEIGIEVLNDYKMYGTVFLVTGWYDVSKYLNDYVEFHSHTNNMHDGGICPGGQGGGIKCLDRDFILNDLKSSREKLYGSTALCYPFYEYNNYAIELVKEAGFTMAFAGENSKTNRIYVGQDKYKLPRFVVNSYKSMNQFSEYLKEK